MPPFCCTMAVRFADVDHAGIVYYPKFFDYFHITFEEFFRQTVGSRAYVDVLDRDRIGFPSVNAQCEFKSPLRFGDTMDVEMSIQRLGKRSVTFGFCIYRRPDSRDPEPAERVLAAQGTNTCAIVDLSVFRAIEAPDSIRRLLEPLVDDSAD